MLFLSRSEELEEQNTRHDIKKKKKRSVWVHQKPESNKRFCVCAKIRIYLFIYFCLSVSCFFIPDVRTATRCWRWSPSTSCWGPNGRSLVPSPFTSAWFPTSSPWSSSPWWLITIRRRGRWARSCWECRRWVFFFVCFFTAWRFCMGTNKWFMMWSL